MENINSNPNIAKTPAEVNETVYFFRLLQQEERELAERQKKLDDQLKNLKEEDEQLKRSIKANAEYLAKVRNRHPMVSPTSVCLTSCYLSIHALTIHEGLMFSIGI